MFQNTYSEKVDFVFRLYVPYICLFLLRRLEGKFNGFLFSYLTEVAALQLGKHQPCPKNTTFLSISKALVVILVDKFGNGQSPRGVGTG